jgi:hypothetical protein
VRHFLHGSRLAATHLVKAEIRRQIVKGIRDEWDE